MTQQPSLTSQLIAHLTREQSRWALWMPVGIGLGVMAYFSCGHEPSPWWLAATPILAMATRLIRHRFMPLVPMVMLLTLALGFNAAQLERIAVATPMLDREVGPTTITGTLMITEPMPDGARLTLKDPLIERLPPDVTPDRVRMRMRGIDLAEIPPAGTRVSLWGQVGPLSEPVMPGAYDFRRQGFFLGLGGTGWARGTVKILDSNPPLTLVDRVNLWFEHARRSLTLVTHDTLTGDSAAMTAALLNGEQNGISRDTLQAMRISGLSHLLSISGVHVSMMGLLVYVPLRAILALIPFIALRCPIKKWAAAMAVFATIFYTILVGPYAPTLRSALSTGIVMFAIMVDRRTLSMRLVLIAAALVMLMQPDGVMGPSFQMSFAAVLCMVAAFEKTFDQALNQNNPFSLPIWMKWMKKHVGVVVMTSVIATAATAPFTIYHFQSFSFYGVIANMVAIPLTSFWIMPMILLTYITFPLGWAAPFIHGIGWGVDVLIKLAEIVAAWPFAQIHWPAMPSFALLATVAGGLWLCLWRQRWRWMGFAPIVLGMMYPLYTPLPHLVVSTDGSEWAARLDDGRLAVSNLDRDDFVVTQWQQRLGMPPTVDVTELPTDENQLRCDTLGCVYRQGSRLIALPTLDAAVLEDCTQADVVIATVAVKDCAARLTLDANHFHHHGATALRFNDGALHAIFVRPERGLRPWSVGWGHPQRTESLGATDVD